MICLLNRYNLIGMEGEKNLFPTGNYFYFTERQFNWCLFLMYELKNIFFVKCIHMIRLYSFSYICFDIIPFPYITGFLHNKNLYF